jgi:predicted phage tail protein
MPDKYSRAGVAVLCAIVGVALIAGAVGQLAGIGVVRALKVAGLLLIALGVAGMLFGVLQRPESRRPPG